MWNVVTKAKSMCTRSCRAVLLALLVLSSVTPLWAQQPAGEDEITAAGPYTHKNLSIYFLRGKDAAGAGQVLTLAEALKAKKLIVHETGSVNQLELENLSDRDTIFIQAGDIVKGGRQDRTLAEDLTLAPHSGKIRISSFCVERGRWQPRGAEASNRFESADKRISSKELKIAVLADKQQGKVWQEVEKVQQDLGDNLGKSVRSNESQSSLQLTLEDSTLKARSAEYDHALRGMIDRHSDARGYVFVINGEISAGDLYISRALFTKRWPQLLEASIQEALAKGQPSAAPREISTAEVLQFVRSAEGGAVKQKLSRGETNSVLRESSDAHMYEAVRAQDGKALHKSYIKK